MDAILDEKLDVEGFWSAYVGNLTPLEFMNRLYSPEIRECAEEYVATLPNLWGIVRRQTWRESFGAPWQFRKGEVMAAIVEKLEATEADWRPRLNQRARPEPVEMPVYIQEREAEPSLNEVSDALEGPREIPAGEEATEPVAESLNLHEEQAAGQDEVAITQADETQEPMA